MILSRNTSISLADTGMFFSKRIRRIFPAYYLMIFVVLKCSNLKWRYLAMFPSGYVILIFLQIANYDFLLHAWSLAVEIQFYCVAPLFSLIAHLSSVVHVESTRELHFSSLPSRLWQFLAGSFAFEFHLFLCSSHYFFVKKGRLFPIVFHFEMVFSPI
uniref:Uncharacterized protein n=1 Tax=Parascaris equorum TaxID=6256 RepID=A0A914REU3_PAREQ